MTVKSKRKSGWNYRVMRHERPDDVFYAIHEVYYTGGVVDGWTEEPCGSPFGETMGEMVRDLAWIMTALAKPVLDSETGLEIEPSALLADDLQKMINDIGSPPLSSEERKP